MMRGVEQAGGRRRRQELPRAVAAAALALLTLLTCWWPVTAAAAEPQVTYMLLIDDASALDFADARSAMAAGGFQPLPGERTPNLGIGDRTVWVAAQIRGLPQAGGEPWYIMIAHPPLDEITSTVYAGGEAVASYRTGELVNRRPVEHRFPVLPLPPGHADLDVLLRIRTSGSTILPMTLISERTLQHDTSRDNAFYAAFAAALGAMLAYNFFLWLSTRDRSYLFYVGYLSSFGLLQLHVNGYVRLMLGPEFVQAWSASAHFLLGLAEAMGALLVAEFIGTARLMPRMHRLLLTLAASAMLAGIASPLLPHDISTRLLLLLGALDLSAILTAIVLAMRARLRIARFLAVGFLALSPGAICFLLRTLGVLPSTFWTQHMIEIGTVVEMIVLSFALADRISLLDRERRDAEQAVQLAARQHAEDLVRSLETERSRVAVELHDSIGQNLLVISNQLGRAAGKAADPDLSGRLSRIAEIARQTVQDARTIARRLHPYRLDRLGLRDALQETFENAFADSGIELHMALTESLPDLSPEQNAQIYRIAQEAASNALRHSGARNCWVSLAGGQDGLCLTVEDDGIGIAEDQAVTDCGLGLQGQRDRARRLGANLEICERQGGGTRLMLSLAPELPA